MSQNRDTDDIEYEHYALVTATPSTAFQAYCSRRYIYVFCNELTVSVGGSCSLIIICIHEAEPRA